MVVAKLTRRLNADVDGASLALFRIVFGALLVMASLRFFTHGWIETDYRSAKVFFPYWGLSFVRPWPGHGMYVHYAVMATAAGLVSLGIFYRFAIVTFTLAFTWAHLCDKTNYLNHYYLISLVALLMFTMPLDRRWSLRTLLWPQDRRPRVRAWMLYVLRFQFAAVYFYGGIAKLGGDWLLRAEPLRIWLHADMELPILRHYANTMWLPLAFSWAGALFDLLIVPLLSWRRTRVPAYLAVLTFHTLTAVLFPIGMFPFVMSAGATLFFSPFWPTRREEHGEVAGAPLGRVTLILMATYVVVQLALPLRHFAYPGNTLWTEEGFRWSWRVMLIDKVGDLTFRVVDRDGHERMVSPRDYVTAVQRRQISTQPDMILQLAHVVAADFERRGRGPVRVFASAEVAWNGRSHAPMIDPTVDLARQEDSLAAKPYILPAPTTQPLR